MAQFYNKILNRAEINNEVRKSCPRSPTLYNIHIYEIITKWQNQTPTVNKRSKKHLSTLLFADHQNIIADTEYNLQKAAHELN
jgi:phage FluMu protein Com